MTVVAGNRRRRASDAKVCRLNVFIDPDAYERLMVHSVKAKLMPGLFVEKLINDHCKAWRVQENTTAKSRRAVEMSASGESDGKEDRSGVGAGSSQEDLTAA
jgi:hypothetical protein